MFVREKHINGYTYLYLVETVREDGRTKQRIICNLGRKEAVLASGALDRLAASVGRFAERAIVLQAIECGDPALAVRRIGAPLLFGRLWEETGCAAVLKDQVAGRGFAFDVERAVFVAVLHRLMASGSDRACAHWMEDYAIPGVDGLALHHFYRAMAWLGEELPDAEQAHATPFAPRCVKDSLEEALFARGRDLFTDLSVVFMDTTSLSFEGAGGATLGERGYSKDHRPDLAQMILAVVVDGEGRPICTEMAPGNDVGALHFLVHALEGIRAGDLRPVILGEVHVGEDVLARGVHHGAELRLLLAQRVGALDLLTPGDFAVVARRGDRVAVIEPAALRETYRAMLEEAGRVAGAATAKAAAPLDS